MNCQVGFKRKLYKTTVDLYWKASIAFCPKKFWRNVFAEEICIVVSNQRGISDKIDMAKVLSSFILPTHDSLECIGVIGTLLTDGYRLSAIEQNPSSLQWFDDGFRNHCIYTGFFLQMICRLLEMRRKRRPDVKMIFKYRCWRMGPN